MKKSILDSTYIVHKKTAILPSTQIICALSGGQDSVLLFSILLHLKKIWNLQIIILYCQHFWQVQNIYTVEEIWKLTSLFQIPFSFFFAEYSIQSESDARVWRHKKIYRSAEYFQSYNIAIGHNASDSIETAIWHLARGTSPKGLVNLKSDSKLTFEHFARTSRNQIFPTSEKSRPDRAKASQTIEQASIKKQSINKITRSLLWNRSFKKDFFRSPPQEKLEIIFDTYDFLTKLSRESVRTKNYIKYKKSKGQNYYSHILVTFQPITIIRPLSEFHRSDITLIVSQNNLPYITDQTNQNTNFTRNRIRSEILPILRYSINKQIDFHLYTYLHSNITQQNFLQTILRILIESYCNTPKSIGGLLYLPDALQSECIYKIVKTFVGRQVSRLQIQNLKFDIDYSSKNIG